VSLVKTHDLNPTTPGGHLAQLHRSPPFTKRCGMFMGRPPRHRRHCHILASLLAMTHTSRGTTTCEIPTADLPFGGVCPPSELTCPPCGPGLIKCPSGGCVADVRRCEANVWLQGMCNASVCEGVQWCHVLPGRLYTCWEQWPSQQHATLVFSSVGEFTCSSCQQVRSHYPCSLCCGRRGVANWDGSRATSDHNRQGGGVFMSGSRWICLLRDVALAMSLSHPNLGTSSAAAPSGSIGETSAGSLHASEGQEKGTPDSRTALAAQTVYDEVTFPMPLEWSL